MARSKWNQLDRLASIGVPLLIALDVVAGIFFRFRSTSKLWLDEAQGVNIAQHSFSQIVGYLKNDGAPPLYYFLLHGWMKVVGTSDFDVRAFSGLISVLTLVFVFYAARAWFEKSTAWLAVAVVAVLPYTVYFATETRMYSLVMLESCVLLLVLRLHLNNPRWSTTVTLAVVGSTMLYTHYWAIYFVGVFGLFGLIRWFVHRREAGRRDWMLVLAPALSFVTFLPWVQIFNSQRLHTGTPWAPGPGIYQIFTWFNGFTVNQSVHMVVASLHNEVTMLVFVGLVLYGVFGLVMHRTERTLILDYTGASDARTLTFIVMVTMAFGLVASHVSGSAYVPRYAAVVAIPISFLAARGIRNFETPLRIIVVLGLLSGAALWTDKWGVNVQRSQGGVIGEALKAAPTGSLVYVCPDQLGPSLLRYAPTDLKYIGYPRFEDPSIVNWYDYLDAYNARTPAQNAAREANSISPSTPVYVVWAPNYGLKRTCVDFTEALVKATHRHLVTVVPLGLSGYYQSMELEQLVP